MQPIDRTQGYCLPCKYVLHTVGPIVRHPGAEDPVSLASCYVECLELAKLNGARWAFLKVCHLWMIEPLPFVAFPQGYLDTLKNLQLVLHWKQSRRCCCCCWLVLTHTLSTVAGEGGKCKQCGYDCIQCVQGQGFAYLFETSSRVFRMSNCSPDIPFTFNNKDALYIL